MSKTLKICILSLIALLIIGIVIFFIVKQNTPDNKKFAKEYTSVEKDNLFVYKTGEEIIKILNSGEGVVFIGFPECSWCQAYAPILDKVCKKLSIEKIFYYNIKEDREKNTEVYKKIVSITQEYLMNDDEGNKRVYVPDVYVVKNGKILSHNNETSVMEEGIIPEEYWTNDKKTQINTTLTTMIEQVAAKTCKTCE